MIKKILISQPAPSGAKSPYYDLEEKYGVKLEFRPLVHVERLHEREFRAQKVNILAHTAVIFNSQHAIDHFFSMCKSLRITVPADMKYFFISEKVALYIQKYVQYRKRKVFFSKTGQWADLIDLMSRHRKETYLFPQNEVHHQDMTPLFEAKRLKHTVCHMYRTVSTQLDKSQPFDYDMIVFFTPSGVHSITDNFPDYKQGKTLFGCYGDAAANTIEELGYRLDLKAPQPGVPSITAALDLFLENMAKEDAQAAKKKAAKPAVKAKAKTTEAKPTATKAVAKAPAKKATAAKAKATAANASGKMASPAKE